MFKQVIIQRSNYLSFIKPSKAVLADRGFTISDDLAIHGAKLEIPKFTHRKSTIQAGSRVLQAVIRCADSRGESSDT